MERKNNFFLNKLTFFVSTPAILWQAIFLGIPLLFIFASTFFDQSFFKVSFKNLFSVIDYIHLKIILRTLIVSLLNTILCLIIAYPVAYFLAFKTHKSRNLLLSFLLLPLWINFLVQVYSWFFVLEQNGLINSTLLSLGIISKPLHLINNTFSVVLVMVHVYLPFMIMPLYNVLEKFDFQLIEASKDLGASKWQTFKRITFPLSLPGVYLGFFLVFVMSFGEVAIPLLMGGNKSLFVGSLISDYFLGARNIALGSAFTLFSSIILGIALFIFYLLFRKNLKGSGFNEIN